MTRHNLFLSSLIVLSLTAAPVFAQEKAEKEEKAPAKKAESVVKVETKPGQPSGALKKWIDAENALIDPLSDKDKGSFLVLRQKYSIIRAIEVVEGNIGDAVKACGKANPDIKSKMEDRYKQWMNAVNPIITTAKKRWEQDLDSQKIVDPQKARNVMKLNDEAYEEGDKQVTKIPVSTPEACQALIESMDRTENDMITRLQQTLLPESVIRKRADDAKKANATVKPSATPAKTKAAPAAEPQKE